MSVAGQWNVTMPTPMGTQTFTWDLKESAGTWSGTMQSKAGASELTGVKVDGDKLSFASKVNSPMGSLDVTFNGAVSGANISGVCKTAFGDMQFSGVRG
jgi:hypothetical protein